MAFENEDFEGGTNGGTVGTGNTIYDAIAGTFTFTNADPVRGSLCGKFEASASTSGGPYMTLPTAGTTFYARAYVKFEEWPTTSPTTVFARFASTSTTRNSLRISTTGVIDLRNINTVVDTAATAETLGEWIRLEWAWNTSTQELRIFRGSNLHGTTPDETLSGSASTSSANRLFFPSFTTTPSTLTTIFVDDVAWSDSGWLGPSVRSGTASASASSSSTLTSGSSVRNGTATASASSSASLTGAAEGGGDPSGTASASATSSASLTGSKTASGTATASASSSSTLLGSKGGRLFSESYEGGSAGASVSTSNSGFDIVLNTAATFETTPTPIVGSYVGRYATTLDNARTKAILTDGEIRKAFARFYIYPESSPSGVNRFFTFETDPDASPPGEDVAALRFTTGRLIGVYDGSVFSANLSTNAIPLNQWTRLELAYDRDVGTHGQTILRIFLGSNVHGTTPDETVTVSHVASVTNPVTTSAIGTLNAITQTFSIDGFEIDTTDWIGPIEVKSGTASASASSSSTLTAGTHVRNGTATASASSSSTLTGSATRSGTATASASSASTLTAGTHVRNGTASASASSASTLTGSATRSGTITDSEISAATLTGSATRSGTATASATSSSTLTSAKGGQGTASASATSSASSTGAKAGAGDVSASASSSAALTGSKTTSGTASTSASSSAVLTGTKGGEFSGTASASASSSATITGSASRSGTASASGASVAAVDGSKAASGTLGASATSSVSETGSAARNGTATASASSSASLTGVQAAAGSGTASASAASSAALSGSKSASGTGSASATSSASEVGSKAVSGTFSAGAVSGESSSGLKAAISALMVEAIGAVYTAGSKATSGTVSAEAISSATASGVNATAYGVTVEAPSVRILSVSGSARTRNRPTEAALLTGSYGARIRGRSSLNTLTPEADLRPARKAGT